MAYFENNQIIMGLKHCLQRTKGKRKKSMLKRRGCVVEQVEKRERKRRD